MDILLLIFAFVFGAGLIYFGFVYLRFFITEFFKKKKVEPVEAILFIMAIVTLAYCLYTFIPEFLSLLF
tara:strand:+ start:197 stop:403 length:207 start_codon:yes stop_codon:yes gene_type:complete